MTANVQPNIRRRLRNQDEDQVAEVEPPILLKKQLPKQRTWRTYVRWIARALLVIVLLLSTAKVVRIGPQSDSSKSDTVLLIITHSRANYLDRCLESVFNTHPGSGGWDVIISRDRADGVHSDVDAAVARHFNTSSARNVRVFSIAHEPETDPGETLDSDEDNAFVNRTSYRRITAHYRFAIDAAFSHGAKRVVILEDDMTVGVDFFNYFDSLAPLLDFDDSLWCISAWNDNGKPELAKDATQLYRTDFFPGLGWMLTRELWEELGAAWPTIFWDDWMRNPNVSQGRQCIRPEVARVTNFGAEGASASFDYEQHIAKVHAGREVVDFAKLDLSYLAVDAFDEVVFGRMSNATKLKYSNYLTTRPQNGDVIAFFPRDRPERIGKRTGIMTDHRHGVFRTSYRGVIIIPWNGHWAFIVPTGYEPPEGYSLGARECC